MRTRADIIRELALPGGTVEIDEAGYLIDPAMWSPDFARHLATQEDIDLRDLHWAVIGFMRAYLDDHGVSADVRYVLGFLMDHLTIDRPKAKKLLYKLFPAGHVQHTCKLSGMRQPRAWSTG